jgi:hypothetical protein
MLLTAQILALVSTGRIEEAYQINNRQSVRESQRVLNRAIIAATLGEAEQAAQLQQKFLAGFGVDDSTSLTMEAIRGNRSEANRLARLIDSRPGGYLALMMTVLRCGCGAPFDLDSAPVFASKLKESGLVWPPAKTVNFPLKTW